jgi:hypothetical protein
MVRLDDVAKVAKPFGDDIEDRVRRLEGGVLHEERGLHARAAPDAASIGNQIAVEDAKECGLAGAVAADHGDTLAGFDEQRCVLEQGNMAEGRGNVVERDKWHTATVPWPIR